MEPSLTPESNPSNPMSARTITIAAVVIIIIGAVGYSVLGKKVQTPGTANSTSATSTALATTSMPAGAITGTSGTSGTSASTYKDGTYTATGSYQSPGGDEKIGVSLTLKDDIVTDANVTPEPVSNEGREYQQRFATGFKTLVVGKNISDIALTRVSGSSLTPIGFNDAVAQIETQAKASA